MPETVPAGFLCLVELDVRTVEQRIHGFLGPRLCQADGKGYGQHRLFEPAWVAFQVLSHIFNRFNTFFQIGLGKNH